VLRGSVRFRVGEEERTVEPGGTWIIPSGTPHLVRGGADGAVVLDIFAPTREEWKRLDAIAGARPTWP
jgi:quercetin dioxygenase-like cupin family protein